MTASSLMIPPLLQSGGGTLDLEAFAMGKGKREQKNPGALGEMATLTGGLTGVAKPIYQFPETSQQPLTAPTPFFTFMIFPHVIWGCPPP